MCSCTTHHWLARPVTPHPGDQATAGQATERADAYGAGLAAALTLYDRRTLLDDHTTLLIEISVDTEVVAWLPITPLDNHQPARDGVIDSLESLQGRLLGTDWPTPLPELPATALRVDLDPVPEADDHPGERVPGHPGPSPWS